MFQNQLGLLLNIKLNFPEHVKNITLKVSKYMGLLRKFQPFPSSSSLVPLYNTHVRN